MNVLALTIGTAEVASTHYRLAQFVEPLAAAGVRLTLREASTFHEFDTLSNYDLVILQKRLASVRWVRRVRSGAKKLIFDTDDAIWEPHGRKHSWWTRLRTRRRLRAILAAADVCTVPNYYLADAIRPLAGKVELLPMALNDAEWQPGVRQGSTPLRIGWAGAPGNLLYLARLSDVIYQVQTLRPEVQWVVYCGQPPVWTAPVVAIHLPYQPGTEPEVVRTFDIGLLPLPDDAFAAGKSPIKALQYAACALPCVASPVGATCELVEDGVTGITAVSPEEWRDAILRLIDDAALRQRMGDAARERFLKSHSRKSSQALMVDCWRRLTGISA